MYVLHYLVLLARNMIAIFSFDYICIKLLDSKTTYISKFRNALCKTSLHTICFVRLWQHRTVLDNVLWICTLATFMYSNLNISCVSNMACDILVTPTYGYLNLRCHGCTLCLLIHNKSDSNGSRYYRCHSSPKPFIP